MCSGFVVYGLARVDFTYIIQDWSDHIIAMAPTTVK